MLMQTYWGPISALNVEDKVLDKCHFIQGVNNYQSYTQHIAQ